MIKKLLPEMKAQICAKIAKLMECSVPGQHSRCIAALLWTEPPLINIDLSCSLPGALALDGFKSKYQLYHLFGARFCIISQDWKYRNLVCLCDAGVLPFNVTVTIFLFTSSPSMYLFSGERWPATSV